MIEKGEERWNGKEGWNGREGRMENEGGMEVDGNVKKAISDHLKLKFAQFLH